jgi:hypothetical protein
LSQQGLNSLVVLQAPISISLHIGRTARFESPDLSRATGQPAFAAARPSLRRIYRIPVFGKDLRIRTALAARRDNVGVTKSNRMVFVFTSSASVDQKVVHLLARSKLRRQPAGLLTATGPSLGRIFRIPVFGKDLRVRTALAIRGDNVARRCCCGFLYSAFAATFRAFRGIDFVTRLRCLSNLLKPRAIAGGANNLSQNFTLSFHRDHPRARNCRVTELMVQPARRTWTAWPIFCYARVRAYWSENIALFPNA